MSSTLTNNILRNFITDVFIETGTYIGEGVDEAIKIGYKSIHSIELHEGLYNVAVNKYRENEAINIHQGNSSDVLRSILPDITGKITFWLDGHYSGPHTAIHEKMCPLMEELEAIKTHKGKKHNILIDDIRYIHDGTYGITLDELFNKIKEINPKYEFSFADGYQKNDILVAVVK